LERNSIYYYQRNLNGKWEDPIEFKTHDPDNFRFVFLGDPQIGASRNLISGKKSLTDDEGLRNDAFNWNMTIYNSYEFANEPSLILSAGDNADSGQSPGDDKKSEENIKIDLLRQEREYSTLLLPQIMQKVPFASAIGNHESFTPTFRYHFNTPHSYKVESDNFIKGFQSSITPGYNYFFKYNNVLIVVLESNYSTEEQYREVIENAITTYPETDWRIGLFHHDIYSNGYGHSTEPRVMDLRKWLTPMLDKYDFDLVINGHDHVYVATHFVTSDKNSKNGYSFNKIERNKVYNDPKGTLYLTANCSTGNKLYRLIDPFDFVYYSNQTYTSTFGVLDFKKENGKTQMRITTYEVDTFNVTDGTYIFEKIAKELPKTTTTITTKTTTTTTTNVVTSTPEEKVKKKKKK